MRKRDSKDRTIRELYGTSDKAIGAYFVDMCRANGRSMAYTLTEEFWGISEDDLTSILDELGIEGD